MPAATASTTSEESISLQECALLSLGVYDKDAQDERAMREGSTDPEDDRALRAEAREGFAFETGTSLGSLAAGKSGGTASVSTPLPAGWTKLASRRVAGFKVAAYARGARAVLVFRGTASFRNAMFDLMGIGHVILPNVLELAGVLGRLGQSKAELSGRLAAFHLEDLAALGAQVSDLLALLRGRGAADVCLTGHSLGGFLAQVFAVQFGLPGKTFNAPAMGSFKLTHVEGFEAARAAYDEAFENHCVEGDVIAFVGAETGHLGSVVRHSSTVWDAPSGEILQLGVSGFLRELHSMGRFQTQLEGSSCRADPVEACTCRRAPSSLRSLLWSSGLALLSSSLTATSSASAPMETGKEKSARG